MSSIMYTYHLRRTRIIKCIVGLVLGICLFPVVFIGSGESGTPINVREAPPLLELEEPPTNPFIWKSVVQPKEPCPADSVVDILCIVPSEPGKYEARMNIRTSWGNSSNFPWANLTVRTVFVMGIPKRVEPGFMDALKWEIETFQDILIADFLEDYYNLTTKVRVGIHYAATHCAGARYTAKVDDDVLLDVFRIAKFLLPLTYRKDFIACHALHEKNVIRNKTSKWYIAPEIYPDEKYPSYCNGPFYLMPRGVPEILDKHASLVKSFPMEDVTFTGMVRERAGGIMLLNIHSKTLIWAEDRVARIPDWMLERSLATHRVPAERFWPTWEAKINKFRTRELQRQGRKVVAHL